MPSPSATQHRYPYQNEPKWSKSEKAIARTAFDAGSGSGATRTDSGNKANSQIRQSSDLWDLEHYLTQRRKEIDRKYDYRYSRLTDVFGRLLHERRLSEPELHGLQEDKMKLIHSFAEFLARDVS
jgi:hypothetical protein